jgi:hypothetical protein
MKEEEQAQLQSQILEQEDERVQNLKEKQIQQLGLDDDEGNSLFSGSLRDAKRKHSFISFISFVYFFFFHFFIGWKKENERTVKAVAKKNKKKVGRQQQQLEDDKEMDAAEEAMLKDEEGRRIWAGGKKQMQQCIKHTRRKSVANRL